MSHFTFFGGCFTKIFWDSSLSSKWILHLLILTVASWQNRFSMFFILPRYFLFTIWCEICFLPRSVTRWSHLLLSNKLLAIKTLYYLYNISLFISVKMREWSVKMLMFFIPLKFSCCTKSINDPKLHQNIYCSVYEILNSLITAASKWLLICLNR